MASSFKIARVSTECVACGSCVKACPIRAIKIHKGLYAKPDERKCVGCGNCVKTCPADVIKVLAREAASE